MPPRVDRGRVRKFGRGATLNSQARTFIRRLRDYFQKESASNAPLLPFPKVTERVANALQVSRATVSKVTAEVVDVTPGKKRPRKSPKSGLDSFSETAVRNHIYAYYKRRELPTIRKLLNSLKESDIFDGSRFTLWKIIKNLGFKWRKINNRKFLMERNDVVNWRCNFLREMREIDVKKIVYLDETWINAGHTVAKCWDDDTLQSSRKEPTGRGQRVIIIHAGTSAGFVPNCLKMFRSTKKGDYHEEMNASTFKGWFINLLENIQPCSTIVMDNAPYHCIQENKPPTQTSTKPAIQDWLQSNNIPFDCHLKKAELLQIVHKNKPNFKSYELDSLAKSEGHRVIRQPPYHCHFNPIELIWANVKGKVARNNKLFTLAEVESLALQAIDEIKEEDWRRAVNHVERVMDEAWDAEGILEERVDEMIISIRSDPQCTSSDSSSCTSEEESDADNEADAEAGPSGLSNIRGIQPLPSDSDSE